MANIEFIPKRYLDKEFANELFLNNKNKNNRNIYNLKNKKNIGKDYKNNKNTNNKAEIDDKVFDFLQNLLEKQLEKDNRNIELVELPEHKVCSHYSIYFLFIDKT